MIEVVVHLDALARRLDALAVWLARLSDRIAARAR